MLKYTRVALVWRGAHNTVWTLLSCAVMLHNFPKTIHAPLQERSLAQRTGAHRLPSWCPYMTKTQASEYPEATSGHIAKPLNTMPRTIEHDAQYVRHINFLASLVGLWFEPSFSAWIESTLRRPSTFREL
jgi:hypothetical protein